ncbi:MAG: hypothetical protein U9O41_02915 [Candidatus Aerophobetes bacterium]|nr:hypothetical protein [Candidatus Aerophobetes bacterium]
MYKGKAREWAALTIASLAGALLFLIATPALACDFRFSYERINAPMGTTGEVGVQVEKTHKRCTMDDPLDYQFEGEHIQILGESQWEKVDSRVYEKYLLVSLSSPGEGFLRISCTCSKEGYQEATLPILVTEGSKTWEAAWEGGYPYTAELDREIQSTVGEPELDKNSLTLGSLKLELPYIPEELRGYSESVRVFYTEEKKQIHPLLLVSEDFFLRFDQYLAL